MKRPSRPEPTGPTFRSSAVARMAQMPVATLRIWEQRHAAVRPATAPSGHRLYSTADVQRVLLLRRLTEQGHAIGSLAALPLHQLQQVAELPADAATTAPSSSSAAPLRVVVVGPALALRLQRPGVARRAGRDVRVAGVFDSLAALQRATPAPRADVLIWHAPELQSATLPALRDARKACRARRVAAVYRFAGTSATTALEGDGVLVLREPTDDAAWGDWLAGLPASAPRPARAPRTARATPPRETGAVAPRRFDDAALTAIAGLSPTLACECPRHVAELLMQLSSFETYSAGCIHRSPQDAELHGYLQQVAGTARTLFEAALERVARHEGLPLG